MSKYKVNIAGLSPAENAQIAAALASGQSVTLFPVHQPRAEATGIVRTNSDNVSGE